MLKHSLKKLSINILIVFFAGFIAGLFLPIRTYFIKNKSFSDIDLINIIYSVIGGILFLIIWFLYSKFRSSSEKEDIIKSLKSDSFSYIPAYLFLIFPFNLDLLNKFILFSWISSIIIIKLLFIPNFIKAFIDNIKENWIVYVLSFVSSIFIIFFIWGLIFENHFHVFVSNLNIDINAKKIFRLMMYIAGLPFALLQILFISVNNSKKIISKTAVIKFQLFLIIPLLILVLWSGWWEYDHPFLSVLFIIIIGLILTYIVKDLINKNLLEKIVTLFNNKSFIYIILSLLFISFVFIFTYLQFIRHYSLHSHSYDTTFMLQWMWGINELGYPYCTVGGFTGPAFIIHTPFIYYLLAPIVSIYPYAETLAFLQALIIASGIFAVYLLAKFKLKSNIYGLLFAFIYFLHPALQTMNMFTIHALSLSIPFYIFAIYFLEKKRNILFLIFLVIGMFCREDTMIIGIIIGLYLILIKKEYRKGLIIGFISVILFLFTTGIFMKYFGGKPYLDRYNYFLFGHSVISLLEGLIFNPIHTMVNLINEKKLEFILLMSLSSGFFSLLSGRYLILFLVGAISTILSYHIPHFTVGYQYSSFWFVAVIVTSIFGIRRFKTSHRFSLIKHGLLSNYDKKIVIFLLILCILTGLIYGSMGAKSYKLEFVWKKNSEYYYNGWIGTSKKLPYKKAFNDFQTLRKINKLIPKDAAVSADIYMNGHVAYRKTIVQFPYIVNCDYVVIDTRFGDKKPIIDLLKKPNEWGVLLWENKLLVLKKGLETADLSSKVLLEISKIEIH